MSSWSFQPPVWPWTNIRMGNGQINQNVLSLTFDDYDEGEVVTFHIPNILIGVTDNNWPQGQPSGTSIAIDIVDSNGTTQLTGQTPRPIQQEFKNGYDPSGSYNNMKPNTSNTQGIGDFTIEIFAPKRHIAKDLYVKCIYANIGNCTNNASIFVTLGEFQLITLSGDKLFAQNHKN